MKDDTLIWRYEQTLRDIDSNKGQIDALEHEIYGFECRIKQDEKKTKQLELRLRQRGLWPIPAAPTAKGE